jgi:hypothetical protein
MKSACRSGAGWLTGSRPGWPLRLQAPNGSLNAYAGLPRSTPGCLAARVVMGLAMTGQ